MTDSEANVTSRSSGYQSLVARASAREAGASALAAWRTGFESLALPGFGHATTLAAMGRVFPVCASLSLSAAQLRSTSSVRGSVRMAGGFLPTPQPQFVALHSAHQHRPPLAALVSSAVSSVRRFAATRQRCRQFNGTPNHALQRTAGMSVPVRGGGLGPTGSVTGCAAHHEAPAQPAPSPRAAVLTAPASGPPSLSLGSLAVLSAYA